MTLSRARAHMEWLQLGPSPLTRGRMTRTSPRQAAQAGDRLGARTQLAAWCATAPRGRAWRAPSWCGHPVHCPSQTAVHAGINWSTVVRAATAWSNRTGGLGSMDLWMAAAAASPAATDGPAAAPTAPRPCRAGAGPLSEVSLLEDREHPSRSRG